MAFIVATCIAARDALAATEPTQVQIEAAAKAIRSVQQQQGVAKGGEALARAALTAVYKVK